MTEKCNIPESNSLDSEKKNEDQKNPNDLMRQMDHALQFGDINDLKVLFEHGMSVDQTDFEGRTPLMMSAAKGKRETVEMLINLGADVNYIFMFQGRLPRTALDAARESGRNEIEQILLKSGAKTGEEILLEKG